MRQQPRPNIRRPIVARRAPKQSDNTLFRKEMREKAAADAKAISDWMYTMKGIAYAKERKNWIVVSVREAQRYLDSL